MKKLLNIILFIIFILVILGIIFYMIDTVRVNNEAEPIFTFIHKIADGNNYFAKIDYGLGYKIIRFEFSGDREIIRTGPFFIDENAPQVEPNSPITNYVSGDSGEVFKITIFGENYEDTILISGEEREVDAKLINSKLDYSMTYYYNLFDYTGFEEYDYYVWNMTPSGEEKSTMTITNVSEEETYQEEIKKIQSDKNYQLLSGDQGEIVYYKVTTENEKNKINYIYIIERENLKFIVNLYYPEEVSEEIGMYMKKMKESIK